MTALRRDIVCALDGDGRILSASPSAEHSLGWTEDELVGRFMLNFVHPEDVQRVHGSYLAATPEVPHVDVVHGVRSRDRQWHWFDVAATMTFGEDGRPAGIELAARDVTERREAEQELRRTAARLDTLAGAATGGILMEDAERRITVVSEAFCRLFSVAVPREALIGARAHDALAPMLSDDTDWAARDAELVATGRPLSGEVMRLANDRTLERDYVPIGDGDGHLWIFRDITDHKRLEDELRQTVQARTDFLATMSHEIRTPLSGIAGAAELLLADEVEGERRELAAIVRDAAGHPVAAARRRARRRSGGGRPHRPRGGRLRPAPPARDRGGRAAPEPALPAHRARHGGRGQRAGRPARGRRAYPPDPAQSRWERGQVHRDRRDRAADDGPRAPPDRHRRRHRPLHRAGVRRAAVRAVGAQPWPRLARHRTRARHRPQAGARDGRRRHRGQPARRGVDVHARPAAGRRHAGDGRSRGLARPAHRPRPGRRGRRRAAPAARQAARPDRARGDARRRRRAGRRGGRRTAVRRDPARPSHAHARGPGRRGAHPRRRARARCRTRADHRADRGRHAVRRRAQPRCGHGRPPRQAGRARGSVRRARTGDPAAGGRRTRA